MAPGCLYPGGETSFRELFERVSGRLETVAGNNDFDQEDKTELRFDPPVLIGYSQSAQQLSESCAGAVSTGRGLLNCHL
jgi:hypothetical protein